MATRAATKRRMRATLPSSASSPVGLRSAEVIATGMDAGGPPAATDSFRSFHFSYTMPQTAHSTLLKPVAPQLGQCTATSSNQGE